MTKNANNKIGQAFIACFIGLCTSSAQGAVTSYLDATSWAAAVGPANVTEDFNGFVSDTPLGPTPVALAGGMSLQVDLDALDLGYVSHIVVTSPVGVDGTNYAAIRLIEDVGGLATTMRLDFAGGATAWGADFAGLGGVGGGTFVIDVHSSGGSVLGTIDPASLADPSGGGSGFIGFNATGGDIASYLTFYMPAGGITNIEAFAMDNIAAVMVPEPSIIALGVGLLGIGLMRRRRPQA